MEFDGHRYRPKRLLDLFDEAFDLYKEGFGPLLSATFCVFIVVTIIIYLLDQFTILDSLWLGQGVESILDSTARNWAGWACIGVGYGCLVSVLTVIASAMYLRRKLSLRMAFIRALWSAVWAGLLIPLYVALTIGGLCACIIPGALVIWVGTLWSMFLPVMITERVNNPLRALGRSFRLTSGSVMALVAGQFVSVALCLTLSAAAILVTALVGDFIVSNFLPFGDWYEMHPKVIAVGAVLLTLLAVIPFQACILCLQYFDLRIRKEGFDMQVLGASLGYTELAHTVPSKIRKLKGKG